MTVCFSPMSMEGSDGVFFSDVYDAHTVGRNPPNSLQVLIP